MAKAGIDWISSHQLKLVAKEKRAGKSPRASRHYNQAMANITHIAIAVVEREDQFLIGQRPEGVALAGLWEFAGGKLLPGESPEDGAIRECFEETGLIVRARFRYPEHVEEYSHDVVQLQFIACEVVDSDSVPREPFRWVRREELRNYEFPVGNRGLLALLCGSRET